MQSDPILGSLDALRRSFFYILGISVIVSVLAYGIAKNIPGAHEVHFSYMISLNQDESASGYTYDGFYALSASELFSETLAGIASSPEIVVAAYKQANMELPTQDAIRLARTVRSEMAAPQLVRIIVRDASKQNAEKLAGGLTVVLNKAIDDYNAKNSSRSTFNGIPTSPYTFMNTAAPFPISASIFMLVFVGGNMAVLFREALKRGAL